MSETNIWALTHRDLPGKTVDNQYGPIRTTRYGELVAQPLYSGRQHGLADEGSYYVVTNATPGTGIAGHAAPTTLGTKPLLFLRNTSSASGTNKRLYMDYVRLQVTAAGANGTNVRAVVRLDKGNDRYASGGTALTPINTNMESTDTSGVTCYFGAVTADAASSDVRLVSHQLVRSVINVVADTYLFTFGAAAKPLNSLAVGGTAIANVEIHAPPVVVGPEQMLLLHMLAASQDSAASYEVEAGFWVR